MEFPVNAQGKRIFPPEFKKKVLEELSAGATVAELVRKYGVSSTNVQNWRKSQQLAAFTGRRTTISQAEGAQLLQEMVPLEEYKRMLEENKNLRRSLANMTVDRDILKEAVDLATKKKWI